MGQYQHTLDPKNRLKIPSPFRPQVEGEPGGLVITTGLDQCLFVYLFSEWERLGERLRRLSTTHTNNRAFVRLFFAGAHLVEPDTQGRITVPPPLREYAGIRDRVTIVGARNKFELWEAGRWQAYYQQQRPIFEKLSERIMDLEL
jgi:MraZ protein